MTTKQLRGLSWKLLKLGRAAGEAAKRDLTLKPISDLIDQAWTTTYRLADQRERDEARRKDKGEILWTVFFPREYAWETQKVVTRTPHMMLTRLSYSKEQHVRVSPPGCAWAELAVEWGRCPADPEKMRKRAEMVAGKPREFWANLEQAA